jgi:hypothetical protein
MSVAATVFCVHLAESYKDFLLLIHNFVDMRRIDRIGYHQVGSMSRSYTT